MNKEDTKIKNNTFLKTKIIVTFGPSMDDEEVIQQLIEKGIRIFRINTSHGDLNSYQKAISKIRKIADYLKVMVLIILDLKGPEIRINDLKGRILSIEKNDKIKIFYDKDKFKKTEKSFLITYDKFNKLVGTKDILYIDDGKLVLEVSNSASDNGYVLAEAKNSYKLLKGKKINVANKELDAEFLVDEDKKVIEFGVKEKIDIFALSFVNSEKDVQKVRNFIKNIDKDSNISIMSKIENISSIQNIDKIIYESDFIMVARGDLAVQTDYYKLGTYEKNIVFKAQRENKPVFVATQMLDSMLDKLVPNRSEIIDAYFAGILGVDGVVLTQETAIGKYPIEVIDTMIKLNNQAELDFNYDAYFSLVKKSDNSKYARRILKIINDAKREKINNLFIFSNNLEFIKIIAKYHTDFRIFVFYNSNDIDKNYLFCKYNLIPIFQQELNLNNLKEFKINFSKYRESFLKPLQGCKLDKFMILDDKKSFILTI